jgi:hypothetical protein
MLTEMLRSISQYISSSSRNENIFEHLSQRFSNRFRFTKPRAAYPLNTNDGIRSLFQRFVATERFQVSTHPESQPYYAIERLAFIQFGQMMVPYILDRVVSERKKRPRLGKENLAAIQQEVTPYTS